MANPEGLTALLDAAGEAGWKMVDEFATAAAVGTTWDVLALFFNRPR